MEIASFIISIVAILASVFGVIYTTHKTQEQKYFDMYLKEKERVYAAYWAAFAVAHENPDKLVDFKGKTYELGLYAPDSVYNAAFVLAGDLVQNEFDANTDKTYRLLALMREDLERCKDPRYLMRKSTHNKTANVNTEYKTSGTRV